jgi:hypothetical protein
MAVSTLDHWAPVETLDEDRVTAVVDHRDDHVPLVLQGRGFACAHRHAGGLEGQHALLGKRRRHGSVFGDQRAGIITRRAALLEESVASV